MSLRIQRLRAISYRNISAFVILMHLTYLNTIYYLHDDKHLSGLCMFYKRLPADYLRVTEQLWTDYLLL